MNKSKTRKFNKPKKPVVSFRKMQEEKGLRLKQCQVCLEVLPQDNQQVKIDFQGQTKYEIVSIDIFCGHKFHLDCIRPCMLENIKNKQQIMCPIDNCNQMLSLANINTVFDSSMTYEQLYKKKIVCENINCKEILYCNYEDKNPIACKCGILYDPELGISMSLKALSQENRKLFVDMQYRQCQQCLAWIERNGGCNHMTCTCKYSFCYDCGQKWKTCNCKYDYDDDGDIAFDLFG